MKKLILPMMIIMIIITLWSPDVKGQEMPCKGIGQVLEDRTMAEFYIEIKVRDVQENPIRVDALTQLNQGLTVRNSANEATTETNQQYAMEVEGIVYIWDGYAFDNDNNPNGPEDINGVAGKHVKLFVEDGIATEELIYLFKDEWTTWPDYVFDSNYALLSLDSLDSYIQAYNHLPNIPSQAEVRANGVSDKQMNIALLEKVEELTLYTIQQEESIEKQRARNKELMDVLKSIGKQLDHLSDNH